VFCNQYFCVVNINISKQMTKATLEAFIDLTTHALFDVKPTFFEQFALRHMVDFGGSV